MNIHAGKPLGNKSNAIANNLSKQESEKGSALQHTDNRSEAIALRKMKNAANGSLVAQAKQLKAYREMGNGNIAAKGVLQRMPATAKGLTHLVEKSGNSIMKGEERDEINHNDVLDVDPGNRIRSRRGPNQEMVGDYDRRGEHIYRWFLVNKIDEEDIQGRNLYIREETFEFNDEGHNPKVSKDLSGARDKRTRQSHVGVRFEVWYNSHYFDEGEHPHKKLDQTGHMVMKDYFKDSLGVPPYIAYEMGGERPLDEGSVSKTESEKVKEHDNTGIELSDAPKSTYKALIAKNEREDEINERLNTQTKVMGKTSWIKAKPEGEERPQVKRFDKKEWIEILVPIEEYIQINDLFKQRKEQGGFYCFYLEARTELGYELATRCLSVIEDIAIERGMGEELKPGHAKEVMDNCKEIFEVTTSHTGEEDVEE